MQTTKYDKQNIDLNFGEKVGTLLVWTNQSIIIIYEMPLRF